MFVEQREVFVLLGPFWNGNFEITLQKGATLFGEEEPPKFSIHILRKGDTAPIAGAGEGYTLVEAARGAIQTYQLNFNEYQVKERQKRETLAAIDKQRALAKNLPSLPPPGGIQY